MDMEHDMNPNIDNNPDMEMDTDMENDSIEPKSRHNPPSDYPDKHIFNTDPINVDPNIDYPNSNPNANCNNPDEEEKISNIRVTRSCQILGKEDAFSFDVEYMVRCLSIAIMRHIESSKESFHIIELLDNNEKFVFFNKIYTSNLKLFNTFFHMDPNKVSNLENLDIIEKKWRK